MPGLVPGIHAVMRFGAAWMAGTSLAGTSPAMTAGGRRSFARPYRLLGFDCAPAEFELKDGRFAAAASGGALRASSTSNSFGATLCQANDAEICPDPRHGAVKLTLPPFCFRPRSSASHGRNRRGRLCSRPRRETAPWFKSTLTLPTPLCRPGPLFIPTPFALSTIATAGRKVSFGVGALRTTLGKSPFRLFSFCSSIRTRRTQAAFCDSDDQ